MSYQTIIAMLHDRPGVLHRTVTVLRRRGYNIVSLTVGRSDVPSISRMTLVVDAADAMHVVQQLNGLVEVIDVANVAAIPSIQRERAMIRIMAPAEQLMAVADAAHAAGAHILDLGVREIIMEITDSPERVDAFIATMPTAGIAELMRTGPLAMPRGHTPPVLDTPGDFRTQADGASHDEAA